MSYLNTTWDVPSISELSGSNIDIAINYNYSVLSGYWSDTTDTTQTIVLDQALTADPSAYRTYINGDFWWSSGRDISSLVTSSFVAGRGWKYSFDTLDANDFRIVLPLDGIGDWDFGHGHSVSYTSDGPAVITSPFGNAPNEISSAWSDIFTAGGLASDVFDPTNMTGTGGWLSRFFEPYLGYKQAMRMYASAMFCPSGWEEGETSATPFEPYLPLGPTSGVHPISAYPSAGPDDHLWYEEVYYDVAEYIYGWSTIETGLTAVTEEFFARLDNIYGTAASGVWIQEQFRLALSAGNNVSSGQFDTDSFDDAKRKAIFTGLEAGARPWLRNYRDDQYIAGLRLSWDKEFVKLPLSAVSGTSADIWDTGTARVLHYLLINYEPYNVIRNIIPKPG